MLTENQKLFVYWVTERESIRKKKEAGLPAPWTDNPVMQETYFTNVNREDDKVTRWIRNNWKYEGRFKECYDFAMVVARLFNNVETLKAISQPVDDLEDWLFDAESVLLSRRTDNKQIWGGAYMITTNRVKYDKILYFTETLLKLALYPNFAHNKSTLEASFNFIRSYRGFGPFLSAQIVADLKNTVGHPMYNAPDKITFSMEGVGSLRGLNWFFEEKVTDKNYHEKIKEAYELIEFELEDEILNILCMQNFQNCFCEFDKFMRVSKGTGHSKRKYNGKGE